jgi:hypothetical protein
MPSKERAGGKGKSWRSLKAFPHKEAGGREALLLECRLHGNICFLGLLLFLLPARFRDVPEKKELARKLVSGNCKKSRFRGRCRRGRPQFPK